MEFFEKIVSNTNFNTLTILTFFNFNYFNFWTIAPSEMPGPESVSGYNAALKIQAKIFLWQQVKIGLF